MENLIVDTKKLNESGQDIIRLTREMNEEINSLFSRISSMNTITREWIGSASAEFIKRSNIEKIQYIKLINSLNKYGQFLIDASNDYDYNVKK